MKISVIDLLVPTDIQVEDVTPNLSKLTLEPLERGFGHTLGNALRRMLEKMKPFMQVLCACMSTTISRRHAWWPTYLRAAWRIVWMVGAVPISEACHRRFRSRPIELQR